jgi:hypothetical protein
VGKCKNKKASNQALAWLKSKDSISPVSNNLKAPHKLAQLLAIAGFLTPKRQQQARIILGAQNTINAPRLISRSPVR